MRQAALFVLLLCAASSAYAQFEPIGSATQYMRWETTVAPDSVRPGGEAKLVLDAYIAAPWKLYALEERMPDRSLGPRPFGVTTSWSTPEGVVVREGAQQSTPESGLDPNFGLTLDWYYERARFIYTLDVASTVAEGIAEVEGEVRFQICNDDRGLCLPPTPMAVSAQFVIDPDCLQQEADVSIECSGDDEALDALFAGLLDEVPAGSEGDADGSAGDGQRRSQIPNSAGSGLLGFLLLAIGAGLASLLTPCVFPMVPLTVSYFTKHAEDRPTAIRMALVFGAAIVALFSGLGILLAGLVGAAGAQTIAANPWVNLFIAAVLIGFALALLGLYELRLPSGLLNYTNRRSAGGSGYVGAIFMGLTLTLVSFSCTAPFVGGLLAAASGGTWLYPLAGMIAYSAAFATPFVFLAAFPNMLASLPRAGGWMNVLKAVLGFVELAAAIKFISNADLVWGWDLISRPMAIAVTIVIFLIAGTYLLGKIRLPHDQPVESVGVGRLMASMGFFALSLYMLPGLLGAPLNALDAYLPPRQGTDISLLSASAIAAAGQDDEAWHVDDIEGAMEEGRSLARPVLVDFTGYTCTNCREMEANIFPRPAVRQRFEDDFVLLRLYTDGLERGTDFQRYQLGLTGTVALPTYAIVDPTSERLVLAESGLMKEDRFVEFLDRGSSNWAMD